MKKLFKKNLFLIGFMGSGKSTVAGYLREKYGMKVVEMDQAIEEREGKCISDIFALHGEEYFRNLETAFLREMESGGGTVVSCGGGAALRAENVEEMKKNGWIVLLTAEPQTILDRVKDSDDRPLLSGNKNVEYIAKLMEKRREKYEAAADIVVATDHKSVGQICEELADKVMEREKKDV